MASVSSSSAVRLQVESALWRRIPGALSVRQKPAPAVLPTGVAEADAALGGGVLRGALTEICGPESSGRTSLLLALLARTSATAQESCALVDASDAFDPASAAGSGADLRRLLWVRCSEGQGRKTEMQRLEQALKSADLLLQGGGFGLVVIDLAGISGAAARRVPLTTWFRFRRAVEETTTALVTISQQPLAGTCASMVAELRNRQADWQSVNSQTQNSQTQNSQTKMRDGSGDIVPANVIPATMIPATMIPANMISANMIPETIVPLSSSLPHGCLLRTMEISVEVTRARMTTIVTAAQRKPPAGVSLHSFRIEAV